MKAARHLAGIATGFFMALGMAPANAIEVGQKRHIDIVRDEMKDWELVSASRVGPAAGAVTDRKDQDDAHEPPFPGSPILKAADVPEGHAPVKPVVKPAPLLLIFNQKGTENWRMGTLEGNTFHLRAEGNAMTLTPVAHESDFVEPVEVSYQPATQFKTQQAAPGLCGPAQQHHEMMVKGKRAAPVFEGIQKDGQVRHTLYASYNPANPGWAYVESNTNMISCVRAFGQTLILADREEFKRPAVPGVPVPR